MQQPITFADIQAMDADELATLNKKMKRNIAIKLIASVAVPIVLTVAAQYAARKLDERWDAQYTTDEE